MAVPRDHGGVGSAASQALPDSPRDLRADGRDDVAESRDDSAESRDLIADQRDVSADHRDRLADLRDELAEQSEASARSTMTEDMRVVAAQSRWDARDDRSRAMQDRHANAAERLDARHDRRAATVDRDAAATDRASAEDDRESAALDPLTGVFLRRAGMVQLKREMSRATRAGTALVLAFIDVDHLKAVNDTRGHPAGDVLLRTVAEALRTHLRAEDLIFRYGGDEFVCACVGLTVSATDRRLDEVRAAIANRPEPASISVGLAELEPTDSAIELIRRADVELYRSRRRPLNPLH
jgi:diguanylate cyclase (GGDEF)-like protein